MNTMRVTLTAALLCGAMAVPALAAGAANSGATSGVSAQDTAGNAGMVPTPIDPVDSLPPGTNDRAMEAAKHGTRTASNYSRRNHDSNAAEEETTRELNQQQANGSSSANGGMQ